MGKAVKYWVVKRGPTWVWAGRIYEQCRYLSGGIYVKTRVEADRFTTIAAARAAAAKARTHGDDARVYRVVRR